MAAEVRVPLLHNLLSHLPHFQRFVILSAIAMPRTRRRKERWPVGLGAIVWHELTRGPAAGGGFG